MTMQIDSKISLSELRQRFQQGQLLSVEQRQGFWHARFVGPLWLRLSGMPSCYLSGLWGWQGKKFTAENAATNVLKRGDRTIDALHMKVTETVSKIDSKPVITLSYPAPSPMPWRWVTDELRVIDDHTLLGMTRLHLPILRHFTIPFLLEKKPS